ncbi:Gem-associated protein 5 [Bagarius yarrelli]|uniref:Gem-associated protein 5 n=1 Tax=Bagarius yarrelli TaxID=175774 RepID=A0A556VWT8_BAGYA|nr:Gem-associated protein 5 [Bagarius yarrelli]
MHERLLPASPNWYCSRCSDVNSQGVLGFGARNTVYLLKVSASSAEVFGELRGHTERVSGFSFCRHDGQEKICASSSDDKTVKIWDVEQKLVLEEHRVHQKALLVSGDEKGVVVCHWLGRGDTRSFFPEPRTIFCLSCSPHAENCVAIGYKDGMIVLIDISRKGDVTHRLRGHEEEIHALAWCPDPREDTLYTRAEDGADVSSEVEVQQGGYLASGVMTLKLPFLKRRGAGVDPGVKERLWLTVHWPKGRPAQVVSSCFGFSPVATGCLALGVGDNMIRVWNTLSLQNPYETKTFWQGIKSKVTALAWHPVREGTLAFGTDDGKVGIYEVYSNKPPQISSTYHRRTVYSLDWGPPVPPLSFGAGDKPDYTLYSCAGEGVIFQHDPRKLSDEATNIDKLIRDSNDIKHNLSPHTDLSWKPDGKILAVGNEDGSIDVYEAPSLKLLCTVQQHHKLINTLRWNHQHSTQPELHCLLASGSSNALVYIHDLRAAIVKPSESPALVTEAFRTLSGHTNKITGLEWSPHHHARLVTVWDVLKQEPVCNYRGHSGRVLCVQWSPVNPDLIWTGADDFTVQEWAASKQEHVKPPKSRRRVEMEKKKTPAKKTKKKKKVAEKTDQNQSAVGEEAGRGTGSGMDEGQSEDEDEEGQRVGTIITAGCGHREAQVNGENRSICEEGRKGGKDERQIRSVDEEEEAALHPAAQHHPWTTEPKRSCSRTVFTLAAVRHTPGEMENCVPGAGEHIQLGLFADRQCPLQDVPGRKESHVEAGHYDSMMYLRLWKGDLSGALQLATERGQLNDHLLSLAPMGWSSCSPSRTAAVRNGDVPKRRPDSSKAHYSLTDLILFCCHEPEKFCFFHIIIMNGLLKDLYISWSALLEKDGHYTTAAKCYLAADCGFDAAKVIAKKGDVMSLKTAANLAKLVGEGDLCHSLALRCAKDLMHSQDWLAAQEILSIQDSLLVHRLVFCVCELLTRRLSNAGLVAWPSLSCHAWSNPSDERFLSAVHRVWRRVFGLDTADLERVKALRQQLRAVENPPATAGVPTKQMFGHMALDVSLAALSDLLEDWNSLLQEILSVFTRVFKSTSFPLLTETCRLLVPAAGGDVAAASTLTESRTDTTETTDSSAGLLERSSSEPHAALQSTQRALEALQSKVTVMIQQHSHIQLQSEDLTEEQDAAGAPGEMEIRVVSCSRRSDRRYQKKLPPFLNTLKTSSSQTSWNVVSSCGTWICTWWDFGWSPGQGVGSAEVHVGRFALQKNAEDDAKHTTT